MVLATQRPRWWALTLALAGAYFLAGKLGLKLAFLHSSATAVWPASGLALAALLLGGEDLWPGIFLGAFLVNVTTAGTVFTSLCIAGGNTLEGYLGCRLARRFARGPASFSRPQDAFRFVALAGCLSCAAAATIGPASLFLAGFSQGARFVDVWLTWWLGDAVGIILAAPLLLLWGFQPNFETLRRRAAEAALLGGALALGCAVVFWGVLPKNMEGASLGFLCFPLLAWPAFRFGPRETATAAFAMSVAAIVGTLSGHGPYVRPSPNESLVLLQAFIGTISATSLGLAAALSERRRVEGELVAARGDLQRLVRATENRFRRSRARERPLFESNIIGVIEADLQGRVTNANDSFLKMLGFTRRDLESGLINWEDLTPPEHKEAAKRAVAQIRARGRCDQYEKEYFRKDGARIPVLVGGARVEDSSDHVIAFILDITERKQAEIILRAHAEELARSNVDLNDFAYVASHDLQEPLHKIEAFGDRLATRLQGTLDEEAKDCLGRMLKATGRMESLIQDLLALARVTSRGKPMERVDLGAIAEGVVGDLEASLAESGGRVELGPLPVVSADPTQMRQLLQNLIGNALKFRGKDRKPVVKVSGRDRGDGFAELVVADNGIGFEADRKSVIFKPFKRLHSVRDYAGNGMGLAICERIALRHGGQISAESEPGEGARFAVALPLSRELETQARETAAEKGNHG